MKQQSIIKKLFILVLVVSMLVSKSSIVSAAATNTSAKTTSLATLKVSTKRVSDYFEITCTAISGAQYYKLFYKKSTDTTFSTYELRYKPKLYFDGEPSESYTLYISAYNSNYIEIGRSSIFSLTDFFTKPDLDCTTVRNTSIYINMDKLSYVTGFEFSRASRASGKFRKLAQTTNNEFTDTNLQKNHTYYYKVRAYIYNKSTKKCSYSEPAYFSRTTSGNKFELRTSAIGTKKIKLKWNKVPGVRGYKIYRQVGYSVSKNIINGTSEFNEKYELIKTINNSSKTTYTDTSVRYGYKYYYYVCAYTPLKNKKISNLYTDTSWTDLEFTYPDIEKEVLHKNFSKTITWKPVVGADGYIVGMRTYDEATKFYTDWLPIKTLKKSVSSFTTSTPQIGKKIEYRICAYSGNRYSYWVSLATIENSIPAPKNVTARKTNGTSAIISWSAVPGTGSTTYKIYRTKEIDEYYDASIDENTELFCNKTLLGTTSSTSIVDTHLDIGETYYYYVCATRNTPINNTTKSIDSNYSKRATINTGSSLGNTKITYGKNLKSNKVLLKWQKTTGAKAYEIYRSTRKRSGYKKIAITRKRYCTDKKLTKGKTYYYKIRVYGQNELASDLYSGFSNIKSVKIKK